MMRRLARWATAVIGVVSQLALAVAVLLPVLWVREVIALGGAALVGVYLALRRAEPPLLSTVQQLGRDPGRVRCRHHNVVLPWLVSAYCARCGPIDPAPVQMHVERTLP